MVPPTRRQALIGLVALLLLLAATGLALQRAGHGGSGAFPTGGTRAPGAGDGAGAAAPRFETVAAPRGDDARLVVDVAGAVQHPGVYELPAGARVLDTIHRAGGLLPDADTSAVNRAAPVVDGQQVIVPQRPAAIAAGVAIVAGAAARPGAGAATGARVSLNSGDVAAFDTLAGIGPVTAQRIVDDRAANGPFASVDELERVPGVGPATIASLRELVSL